MDEKKIQHLAIIMDGNGRWAKLRGLPRNIGHRAGIKALHRTVEAFQKLGGKYLTIFAFSTENWDRPDHEVSEIVRLVRVFAKRRLKDFQKNGIRLNVFGDKSALDSALQDALIKAESETRQNDKLFFNVCFNYGGRLDILNAVKKIASDVRDGIKNVNQISYDDISNSLYSAGIPDPDMIVRTSGERRISNFLLWQMAYSEFYFVPYHWPDFDEEKLKDVFEEYKRRDRRYGAIKE